jgi:threonine dehydrogenase-like Zn-dependent dehydrogenase
VKAVELPLDDAPRGYEMFQKKEGGAIKVVLKPAPATSP